MLDVLSIIPVSQNSPRKPMVQEHDCVLLTTTQVPPFSQGHTMEIMKEVYNR